jgi:hypothetical protein
MMGVLGIIFLIEVLLEFLKKTSLRTSGGIWAKNYGYDLNFHVINWLPFYHLRTHY